tara:strand:- start:1176 stop:1571 length:396 start_codon:yes stop_codon:yes gene_type:complete
MHSDEIKPTDGRKNNSRKQSIPLSKIPEMERSNVPATNQAKKKRTKQYAKKALKNVFGSEVQAFEALAKKAKDTGNVNAYKMLFDYAYEDEKEVQHKVTNAPVINFFNNKPDTITEKTIDVEHKDITDEES